MLSRLLSTIRERKLCRAGDRVLIGLSGGPDSTALLHALAVVAPRLKVRLRAAVVDHGLRPESAREARAAARRARGLGVPCTIVRVDVRSARGPHVSWQDAARRARLAALGAIARRTHCTRVALGHTADDQAETVLFRILRGTGVRGLAGIPYRRGVFVRPLLDVRRREVLAYLAKRRLDFVSDPSNADQRFARARLRRDVLPVLARENPRVVDALLALAADARTRAVTRAASDPATAADEALPGATSRRARATIARLSRAARGTSRVAVPGGEVEISYGRVRFTPRTRGTVPAAPGAGGRAGPQGAGGARLVRRPGRYRLPGARVVIGLRVARRAPGAGAIFDRDAVAWPLVVRFPRPGDRMRPRGGTGSRKLSDLLIDAKIPRGERAPLPVLADAAGNILLVPGLRPSEVGRPGPATRRWLVARAD